MLIVAGAAVLILLGAAGLLWAFPAARFLKDVLRNPEALPPIAPLPDAEPGSELADRDRGEG